LSSSQKFFQDLGDGLNHLSQIVNNKQKQKKNVEGQPTPQVRFVEVEKSSSDTLKV